MASVVNESSSLWEFKGKHDYVDSWLLMGNPVPVVTIWLLYIAFVLKVGPIYMKNRPPFQLTNIIVIYNIIQVLISTYLFLVGTEKIMKNGLLQTQCLTGTEYHGIVTHYHSYFMAKVTELLDTIFFVLRKRYRQVSFLHVYHHSATVLFSWVVLKYDPAPITIFLGTINSFVHIVMYGYYALSAFPELNKYLWWKAYITKLQLIQFVFILLHAAAEFKYSNCPPPYMVLGILVYNVVLMIILFSDFYIKSYVAGNSKAAQLKALNATALNKQKNSNNVNGNKKVHKNCLNNDYNKIQINGKVEDSNSEENTEDSKRIKDLQNRSKNKKQV